MWILGRLGCVVVMLLALGAAAPPAPPIGSSAGAEQDAELDTLFARLKAAKAPAEAEYLQNMIELIWSHAPSDTVTLLQQRGLAALASGDKQLAFDLFTAVTTLAPDFAEGWHQLGAINFALDAHDEALIDLEHALRLEPRQFDALMGLASIFELYGNKRAELEALRRAYAVNPHIEGLEGRITALTREVEGQGI